MKKNVVKFLSALVLTVFVSSPLVADEAVVTFVKGKVEVLKGDSWVALNVGDTVKQSDTVSTGFQSEAKIKFNGSLMALGALTRITMDQLSSGAKKENVDVYLSTGAVRSKVTHADDTRVDYKVRSPVAVASVRGTDFQITDKGSVSCFEGAVAVYPNTKPRNADGSEEAVEEAPEEEGETEGTSDEGASEEGGEEAAPEGNNGPASPTTPAGEINNDAPVDAVVVGAAQKTTFTKSGSPEKPADNAKKNVNKVKSTVTTQATKETVTSSGASSAPADAPQTAPAAPKTGSIQVTIDFE